MAIEVLPSLDLPVLFDDHNETVSTHPCSEANARHGGLNTSPRQGRSGQFSYPCLRLGPDLTQRDSPEPLRLPCEHDLIP